MEITAEVEGLDETLAAFALLGYKMPRELKQGMRQAVLYVLGEIPEYPPEIEGSRYRRTMTLGRSLSGMARQGGTRSCLSRVESVAGAVTGVIGTAIPYAEWVIGEEQALVHKGRWYRLVDVVRQSMPRVVRILQEFVEKAAERLWRPG